MYLSPVSFKPHLNPVDYWSPEAFSRELACVFADSWHLIGSMESLKKPGDFLSADIVGIPVVVRNFEGVLTAFRNVCAHRQCRLVSRESGHSERLKCPYHGWEFGSDGRTRKIPAAMNFPHFDRENYRLDRFSVELCGQLVFVRVSETGPTLREWMGPVYDKFCDRFDAAEWRVSMQQRLDYPANWKIPVEISLESYHIPEVHPQTFAEDPGESLSDHEMHDRGTAFYTQFLAPRFVDRALRRVERSVLKLVGAEYTGRYEHHHIFPNVTVSQTDTLTLVQSIIPVGPLTSACLAIQVGRRPARNTSLRTAMAWSWSKFTAWLTRQILREDRAMYREVQAGVQGGMKAGLLGRCEERLEAFQRHVAERLNQPTAALSSASRQACPEAGCASVPSSQPCSESAAAPGHGDESL